MIQKYAPLALAALSLLASGSAQSAYMKLSDAGGTVNFLAGNTGDVFSYSTNGSSWISNSGAGQAYVSNNGGNNVSRSLYNDRASAYSDYSVYFIAEGLVVAELEFDYIGSLAGFNGVQKITYTNNAAQGISRAAPVAGAGIELRNMVLSGSNYTGPGGFGSQTANLAFYNDGIVISVASVAALGNHVPEPGSLALAGVALALLGASAGRRRS